MAPRAIYFRVDGAEPVVKTRIAREGAGLQVMIYLPIRRSLRALADSSAARKLSILEARIHTRATRLCAR